MRKASKAELESTNAALSEENTMLHQILSDVVRERKPDAKAFYELENGGDSYSLKLYRSTGAMGGIVLERFYCMGQADSFAVYLLDDLIASVPSLYGIGNDHTNRAIAIGKLQDARRQCCNNPGLYLEDN